jgi:hypothetical protein
MLRGERSWVICLALMPTLFVIFFIVGELFLPHQPAYNLSTLEDVHEYNSQSSQ